ncbi:MAG: DUF2946 domain-containing protein [Bdellovibrio sp.]|nr:DUF2946 domain-containing protein [Methylotenera sp.]
MLSKKLFSLMHKIALFAIVFASLAASISHAIAAQNGTNSFTQEVCTSQGKKISIQVVTTKGQQLSVDFSIKQALKSQNIAVHLEHCPFCSSQFSTATLPVSNTVIIAQLTATAQKTAEYAAPIFASHSYVSPPAQAPPNLSTI